jgi:signal transduction histidine kinase
MAATFSRVTRAQPFVSVDLQAVAQEVVSNLQGHLEKIGGRVDIGALPTIEGEPLHMQQLFQHLIDNALKFRQAEVPPLVTIRSQPLQESEPPGNEVSPTAQWCQIIVADNGIGFDEKYSTVSSPFFNVCMIVTPYEGAGVGLAICRKIAEYHGGSIRHQYTRQGATFIVTLPITQAEENSSNRLPVADALRS